MITKNINNIADILSQKSRQGLNFALDLVKPQLLAHGFRIAKLTATRIELIIPAKLRNKNSLQEVEDYEFLDSQNGKIF